VAWRGSARAATMAPCQGMTPTTHRQGIAQHQHTTPSRGRREARREAQGRHGRNPRCGRRRSRGHGEAIGEISWTGRCTVARSTERTPISMASSGGSGRNRAWRWRPSRESSSERRREGGRDEWPGRERPSHLVEIDQVGWRR
jgi:hypothetical protein